MYVNVGGYSYTQADFVMFLQYLNSEDCIAYLPYGPEVEPSEEKQGLFLARALRGTAIAHPSQLYRYSIRSQLAVALEQGVRGGGG